MSMVQLSAFDCLQIRWGLGVLQICVFFIKVHNFLLQDWVLRKKRELDSLRIAGDVSALQKQLDENLTFR